MTARFFLSYDFHCTLLKVEMVLVVNREKVDSAVKYTGWLTLTKDWGDYLGENWLKCVCICIVFVSVFLSVFISEVKRKKTLLKSTVSWQWQKAEVLIWGEVAERVQFENNEQMLPTAMILLQYTCKDNCKISTPLAIESSWCLPNIENRFRGKFANCLERGRGRACLPNICPLKIHHLKIPTCVLWKYPHG